MISCSRGSLLLLYFINSQSSLFIPTPLKVRILGDILHVHGVLVKLAVVVSVVLIKVPSLGVLPGLHVIISRHLVVFVFDESVRV